MLLALAAGIVLAVAAGVVSPGAGAHRTVPAIEPQVCSSCSPPVTSSGGPVLATNGLTVTPIWWAPSGYSFPGNYEKVVDGYITNIAAASGSTDNVYSVDTEYYQTKDGAKTYVTYSIKAGTPVIDTNPYPPNGCTPAPGYTACITDDQIRTELAKVTSSRGLPTDLAHYYPVLFPPKVETKDRDGTTSAGDYCGYHRAFGSGTNQTVYADLPYNTSGCNAGQAPNGNVFADGEVDTFSHELNEAITDPLNPEFAWSDTQGNEIGDMCGSSYGRPLGSTDPSNPAGSEYNQVINGGKYYTQAEFSNLAFSKLGNGKGCALSEALAENPTAEGVGSQSTTIGAINNDAFPTTLAADGKATSKIVLGVADPSGYSVQGDHVHFSVGVESGTGQCGTLSSSEATTDSNGNATVSYTASTSNVACWVLASEATGGRSAEAVIYQGTTQKTSPTFKATYPTTLQAGGQATTFNVVADNPSSKAVPNTRVDFIIFPGSSKAKAVKASQVHLSYSVTGPNGSFTVVPLTGTTANGNVIQSYVGPAEGVTLPAHATQTYTFRIALDPTVPASKTAGPLMSLEAYLDQVNDASGSGATVGDTLASDVSVPTVASSDTGRDYAIALGVFVVVLGVAGFVFWRRNAGGSGGPPPEPSTP